MTKPPQILFFSKTTTLNTPAGRHRTGSKTMGLVLLWIYVRDNFWEGSLLWFVRQMWCCMLCLNLDPNQDADYHIFAISWWVVFVGHCCLCYSDATLPASSASPPTPTGMIDDNIKIVLHNMSLGLLIGDLRFPGNIRIRPAVNASSHFVFFFPSLVIICLIFFWTIYDRTCWLSMTGN